MRKFRDVVLRNFTVPQANTQVLEPSSRIFHLHCTVILYEFGFERRVF